MQAKVRWFQSLTIPERMEILCEMTDLALALNPNLPYQKHVQPVPGRVQVIELPASERTRCRRRQGTRRKAVKSAIGKRRRK